MLRREAEFHTSYSDSKKVVNKIPDTILVCVTQQVLICARENAGLAIVGFYKS